MDDSEQWKDEWGDTSSLKGELNVLKDSLSSNIHTRLGISPQVSLNDNKGRPSSHPRDRRSRGVHNFFQRESCRGTFSHLTRSFLISSRSRQSPIHLVWVCALSNSKENWKSSHGLPRPSMDNTISNTPGIMNTIPLCLISIGGRELRSYSQKY